MFDSSDETLRPLSHVARKVPNRRGGSGINVSTIWRWALSGCRGVKLTTTMVGGIRMASEADLARFFAATTAAANGTPAPTIRTSASRQRAIEAAERELASA
jgi:hypothetical protein